MDIPKENTSETAKQWDIASIDIHPANLSAWGINPNFLIPFVERLREERIQFESAERGLITFSDLKTIVAWLNQRGHNTSYLNNAIKEALDQQPKVSLAEFKSLVRSIYNNNPIVVLDDMQKKRWGGNREVNGRILTANVKLASIPGFYIIDATVKSNNSANPLKGRVAFFVHDSFSEEIRYTEVKKGVATTRIGQCYEPFTLAAYLEDGTRLELDLNETSYPESFFGNNSTEFQNKVQELYAQKPVYDPEDLQKNRWGGVSTKNGKTLSASVRKSSIHGLFTITLSLKSESAEQFTGEVAFFLHNNFNRKMRFARIKNGKAELRFHTDKLFTVGAYTEDGTELELNMKSITS
jgi:hypothetical protein